MVDLISCDGWKIETIESLGNQLKGYHNIQKLITKKNGTQCGYCTPGMIMNMYALTKNKSDFNEQTIEDSFNGNLCRCTGYRPILDAFKSLCNDKCYVIDDIEDLACQRSFKCRGKRVKVESAICDFNSSKWYNVSSIKEIFAIFQKGLTYKLVAGNTARGVYKDEKIYDAYINIANTTELVEYKMNFDFIEVGAGFTLTDCIRLFSEIAEKYAKFSYLHKVVDHINLITNVPVRNVILRTKNYYSQCKLIFFFHFRSEL